MICMRFDFTVVKRAIISVQNHKKSRFLGIKTLPDKKVDIVALLTIADVKERQKIHLIHLRQMSKKISNMDLFSKISKKSGIFAKMGVFFGPFSTSGIATATRLGMLHPCNFLRTCPVPCDKSSRTQILPDVADGLRKYVLVVEKTLFSLKMHFFMNNFATKPIQLADVVASDSARHFTSERLGPKW